MDRSQRRRVVLLILSAMALFFFFRTPGAESVRTVQILLLFAAGACTGVALGQLRAART